MTKRKIIKQIKANVKAEIEWQQDDLTLKFGRGIIGDTIILKRNYFHYIGKSRYMYKKAIVMDLYRVESINKDSLGKISKTSLEIKEDEISDELIKYIKEWGAVEGMLERCTISERY